MPEQEKSLDEQVKAKVAQEILEFQQGKKISLERYVQLINIYGEHFYGKQGTSDDLPRAGVVRSGRVSRA